eukprot:COSAG01_NODE_73328_length_248_cov_1.973154_1_plen_36_part_10
MLVLALPASQTRLCGDGGRTPAVRPGPGVPMATSLG